MGYRMAATRGPRGENVSVVVWKDPNDPHTLHIEAFARSGERPGTHPAASGRAAELANEGMVIVGIEKVRVQ